MAACEKCWRDAGLDALLRGGSVSDHYRRLLDERRDKPCTEAEQRGAVDGGTPDVPEAGEGESQ